MQIVRSLENVRPLARLALIAAVAATLSACGGGGGSEPASAPLAESAGETTPLVSGTVTGFGSVIVDGVRYDDSTAAVLVASDPSQPRTAEVSVVRLGMQVEVDASRNGIEEQARSITIEATVIGRIDALGSGSLTVAGQVIVASADPAAPTFYEGAAGLADFAVGERIEVHGQRDAAGAIVATRIERRDPRSADLTRVVGVVSGFDSRTGSFMLGGLAVGYSDQTRIVPAASALADGRLVAIWSDQPVANGRIDAKAIKIKRRDIAASRLIRFGGRIRAVDFAAQSFVLDGLEVDASKANFPFGGTKDLANGVWVRVTGAYVDGKVVAREVKLRKRGDDDTVVSLTGTIRDFVSLDHFSVRGVPVDASAPDVVFNNGAATQLTNGAVVRIRGEVRDNVVRVTEVWVLGAATTASTSGGSNADPVEIGGVAYAFENAAGSFRIAGVAVRFDNATVFVGGVQNLRSGATLRVAGRLVNGVLVATRVTIDTARD